jgi:hypothetical protein
MANEVAVCLQTPTRFRRYTVADGTAIPKGTILKLTTPMTAVATAADNDPVAGIAWEEKVASDGITEITAALDGVWGITTSNGSITVGNEVTINGLNEVKVYTTLDDEKGYVLGRAMETSSSAVTIAVAVWVL